MQQVVYESAVIQHLPGTREDAIHRVSTGHPQGGASGMSSHIQQAMGAIDGAPTTSARDIYCPQAGRNPRPYIYQLSFYSIVPPAS
jgi:hypothetical protein